MIKTSWKYFLVVAEELNISRAAKKLRISQQSLSQHIKLLESTYNTVLFYRKPTFSLAPAGEVLLNSISQVQAIENKLTNEIDTMKSDFNSTMTIGITPSRALVYMADVIFKFNKIYPNVDIFMPYNTSENLVSRLCRGIVDIYIGIGPITRKDLTILPLMEERVFLIVSKNTLRKYGLLDVVTQEYSFQNSLNILDFKCIPYISNHKDEMVASLYSNYFIKKDISFSSPIQSDSSQLRTMMCTMDLGLTIVLEPMTLYAVQHNAIPNQHNPLYIFPLEDLTLTSILAYQKSSFIPHYMKAFISQVQVQAQKCTYEKYMELYAPKL